MIHSIKPLPIKIGLVFGGASGEHQVSIRSAQTLVRALREGTNSERYDVKCFYIDLQGYCWPSIVAESILKEDLFNQAIEFTNTSKQKGFRGMPEEADLIDIWCLALHGPNGEDGTIQGLFTLMQKPFTGSGVLGSAVSMDKQAMKACFTAVGLPQVPYICLDILELERIPNKLVNRIEKSLGYPCFVKPANLGSSLGISKCNSRQELISGLKLASAYDSRLVVERAVIAREIECAVVGKSVLRASVLGEICFENEWYDYTTKYTKGSSYMVIPAHLSEETTRRARELSLEACRAVGAYGIARVDFFYVESTNNLWVNEINTLPGFTEQSMYPMLWMSSGLTLNELVHQLIKLAQE
uniref:D-alanine--D-alanine ligase n=1 Tax=Paulinella chromatophora TaxID=39717 RepID=B1X3L9_PAUCH|nr:D-alanine--D-alanine ligase [Paulinella chromatophora]ACB42538.1 D-alanine--D-alanine ligase [Paulinella chromatophora]